MGVERDIKTGRLTHVYGDAGRRDPKSFVCPRCLLKTFNPTDVKEGYCANCHDWTGKEQQQE